MTVKKNLPKTMILALMGCWLLAAGLIGCGYTTRSTASTKVRKIYIEPFVNKIDITREADAASKYKIYRPTLETDITKAVANKFLLDGNLKPSAKESADLVLKGELVEFRRDPLRYDENDVITEYRMNLVVNLTLWDNQENKPVWQENNFTGDCSYFVSGSQAKSENTALVDALDDLARRIVERAVEDW